MSEFKEKSAQSLDAAKALIKNTSYYSSCVNRAYYSSLQYMLYVIFSVLKNDAKQFDADCKNNSTGTHNWAAKLIGIQLAKIDMNDYKWFQQKFYEFKDLRVSADYKEKVINQADAISSVSTAESLINLLKKIKNT